METSLRNQGIDGAYREGNYASLESDYFSPKNASIEFDYHMLGRDIGTLSIDVYRSGSWQTIWSREGSLSQDQTDWLPGSVPLDSDPSGDFNRQPSRIKIRIVARAAGGYRGNIAIDNIKLSRNLTP